MKGPEDLIYLIQPQFLPKTCSLTRPSHGSSQENHRNPLSVSTPCLDYASRILGGSRVSVHSQHYRECQTRLEVQTIYSQPRESNTNFKIKEMEKLYLHKRENWKTIGRLKITNMLNNKRKQNHWTTKQFWVVLAVLKFFVEQTERAHSSNLGTIDWGRSFTK